MEEPAASNLDNHDDAAMLLGSILARCLARDDPSAGVEDTVELAVQLYEYVLPLEPVFVYAAARYLCEGAAYILPDVDVIITWRDE